MNQALVGHRTTEALFQSGRIRRDLYKNVPESCSSPLQEWDTQMRLDGARLPWAPVWRVTDFRSCSPLPACLLARLFVVCCFYIDDKGENEEQRGEK